MTYLQVITRTFGRRPSLLAQNCASLMALLDDDWEQTLVIDEIGRGIEWANANLSTVPAGGEWVWILDDDDLCVMPNLIGVIKGLDAPSEYGVIAMRATHVQFGILPHDQNWGQRPVLGDCGFSNFFCRGQIWDQYRSKFADLAIYAADHAFYSYLWDQGVPFLWHDAVAAHYPRRSMGASE